MAKKQTILAISNDYVKLHGIEEGYNTYEYSDFIDNADPWLTLRQRDYLDGIGEKGLGELICLEGYHYLFSINQLYPTLTSKDIIADIDDVVYVRNDNSFLCYNGEIWEPLDLDLIDTERLVNGDPNYRQILPYTVFKLKGKNLFYTYRRTSKVGEERLAGNASVGWGGHIDLIDIDFDDNSIIDLDNTIYDSSQRELGEELKISAVMQDKVMNDLLDFHSFGLINDNSNAVGKLHLGVVNVIEVDEGDILGVNEEELDYVGLCTPEQIMQMNPESWTRLIMEKFL